MFDYVNGKGWQRKPHSEALVCELGAEELQRTARWCVGDAVATATHHAAQSKSFSFRVISVNLSVVSRQK